MTDEEKVRERQLKEEVSQQLAEMRDSVAEDYYEALEGTDPRLLQYVLGVMDNPEDHNLYEQLGVRRFFSMLDKYAWKPKKVRRFLKFYEMLRFNGVKGRRSYTLTPIQTFQFANMFGFVDKEGRRLIRTAYIFVPRKFSKTTSAASLAVYDMLFGDNNAQAYIGANSYKQAKICFDEIRAIMRDLDPSESTFRVNREEITFRSGGRDSLIRCLAANPKNLDGLFASLVIMDEYSQARNTAGKNGADLKNVLTTSMGPRREPLTVIITTASEVIDGPFAHELEGVKRVLRGEAESDTIFASLFMPDVDDEESDPRTWAKVQPHLGVTVQPDFYEKEWATAQLSKENKLAFRTKMLNIFTINETNIWLPQKVVERLLGSFDIDQVSGKPACTVAFDLSVHDDFSAVSYTIYNSTDKQFYTHTDYYFPEGALSGHPNEQLYRMWAESGYLKLCRGNVIDVRLIADDILRRSRKLHIVRIGYDGYKAQNLVNILSVLGGGKTLIPYSQTNGNFNLPVESFELMAWDDPPKIHLNNNPINRFCLLNSVIDEDHMENKKPMKASQFRKIDGVITCLMTIGMLFSYER